MIGPEVQHGLPTVPKWRYWVARWLLSAAGWTVDPKVPTERKLVIIAAPHTSNWDALLMLLASSVYRFQICFLMKKSKWDVILKPFGGIGIDRSGGKGIVGEAAARIKEAPAIGMALAASGTRKRTETWRSGFYWIAMEAGVPIQCSYLDYGKKRISLGATIYPTGDIVADMQRIRESYDGVQGLHPDRMTPMLVREELASPPCSTPPPQAESQPPESPVDPD